MKISRTELLNKLQTISPALSDNNLIPVLMHIWFTGTRAMAYNDQIALSIPLKTDFKGAAPGTTLLDLLRYSAAKEIELTADDETLLVKMGVSKVKLGLMPESSFIFDMPPLQKDTVIKDSQSFEAGIAGCLPSVGSDMTVPDLAGVSVIPNKSGLHLYGCNNATLSHAKVKGLKVKERIILSAIFCEQFLRLIGKEQSWSMQITDDHALVQVGNVMLFGRLLLTDNPQDFDAILAQNFPEQDQKKDMIEISKVLRKSLQLALERAIIIANSKLEPTRTKIAITDGRIKFYSSSERGEITDNIKIDHPDVEIALEAKLLKVGVDMAEEMLITDRCAILSKGNLLYLVSAHEG